MIHKDKLWIKFKDLDIVCVCDYNNRKCPKEKNEGCHLYLAKFIQIDDDEGLKERTDNIKTATKHLEMRVRHEQKKFESEIKRSIRKMNKFRI